MADEYSGAAQEPIKVYENTYIMQPSEKQRYAAGVDKLAHETLGQAPPRRQTGAALRQLLLMLCCCASGGGSGGGVLSACLQVAPLKSWSASDQLLALLRVCKDTLHTCHPADDKHP